MSTRKKSKIASPDELLTEALEIIQIRLLHLRDKAETDVMTAEEDRIVASYSKTLTELQKEIRQSLKDVDAKKLTDDELKEELEKLIKKE